jgi:hypothetical protein
MVSLETAVNFNNAVGNERVTNAGNTLKISASFSALSPAHSTLSHSLFRHALIPPSPFLGPGALHPGMFPWPQSIGSPSSLHQPVTSPGNRTSGSKSESRVCVHLFININSN